MTELSLQTPITALILAAGASRRMGHPKGLLSVGQDSLIRTQLSQLARTCEQTIIVLGSHADSYRAHLGGCEVELRYNASWKHQDITHSILLGILDQNDTQRIIVIPIDTPPIPVDVLEKMAQYDCCCVGYKARYGHPVMATAGWLRGTLSKGTLADSVRHLPLLNTEWSGARVPLNTRMDWHAYFATEPAPYLP